MENIFVNSSLIHAAGYLDNKERLFIEFKNGSLYRYDKVPRKVWNGFLKAESKGKYFHKEIKNKFDFKKL